MPSPRPSSRRRGRQLFLHQAGALLAVGTACGPITDEPEVICPASLPEVRPTRTSTAITAKLEAGTGRWTMVAWTTSQVAVEAENAEVTFGLDTSGALTAPSRKARARSPHVADLVDTPARRAQLEWHRQIWANARTRPIDPRRLTTTQIRGRTQALLPKGVRLQTTTCTAADPTVCGPGALCVTSSGTCESAVAIKIFDGATTASVTAVVRKVGEHVAVLVDMTDDGAVSAGDVDALVSRFDEHIAPRMHQLFGEPKHMGRDRDGNGVVIALLTSKVSQNRPNVVGYFLPDDIEPVADKPHSNEADVLYLSPPSNAVSLDALSGTIGHEYQHLINYTAKVVAQNSSAEERWLDEGLSAFAEEVLGYGADAYKNVLAYLDAANDTSLTGWGLLHNNEDKADSFERRGMAHLFVRHMFERAGGAEFPDGPGAVTDGGGVARIRALVQSADTGLDAIDGVGEPIERSLGELLTSVAVDGTRLDCLDGLGFDAPTTDGYTGLPRGVDLRSTVSIPGGASIPLSGPRTLELEALTDSVPANGGQFKSVGGGAEVSVSGDNEFELDFRVFNDG